MSSMINLGVAMVRATATVEALYSQHIVHGLDGTAVGLIVTARGTRGNPGTSGCKATVPWTVGAGVAKENAFPLLV